MHIMYFTERPYRDVPEDEVIKNRSFFGVPELAFTIAQGRRATLQRILDEAVLRRGSRLRRDHAERASRHTLLHGRRDERRGGNPRAYHQEGADRAARQSAAGGEESGAAGRGTGGNRSDLEGTAGARMGARRGQRADLQQGQSRLQPRILQRGARLRDGVLDAVRAVPLGRQALQFPFRQSVGAALSEAPSADLDSGRDQRRRPWFGARSIDTHTSDWAPRCQSTVELWNLYGETAAQEGYTWRAPRTSATCSRSSWPRPRRRRRSWARVRCSAAARQNFSRPEWTLPPGYNSKEATRRLARQATDYGFLGSHVREAEGVASERRASGSVSRRRRAIPASGCKRGEVSIEEAKAKIYANYQKAQDGLQIIIGTPKIGHSEAQADHGSACGRAFSACSRRIRAADLRTGSADQHPPDGSGSPARDARNREGPGYRGSVRARARLASLHRGDQRDSLVDLEALKRAPKRDESVRV